MFELKKILVVGAGIAGLGVRYWLKRFGFYPVLIEKASSIRKGGQGVDIRGVAVDIVKKMGIYEQICKMRTQIKLGRQVDIMGKVLQEAEAEKFGYRQNEDVEILRGDLVEILIKQIEGVPCYFNQSIDLIKQNDNGNVTVFYRDGKVENYDMVIGADGVHSSIRHMIFKENEFELVNLWASLSIFTIPNYLNLNHTDVQCQFNQKAIFINSDRDPKIAQVGLLFRPQHDLTNLRDKNKQMQILKENFYDFGWEAKKILSLMPNSDDFYFDSVIQVKMRSWTKDRVALIGDAGYCASPFSGQGSNLALIGAYVLAGELKAAQGNIRLAFNRYNELLKSFVSANQQLGVWFRESFFTSDELSKETSEKRSHEMLNKTQIISNDINLPDYSNFFVN